MANFKNTTHETLITGTSAADSIKNYGGKVTISTGNGDDTVDNIYNGDYGYSSANYVSIYTGEGNDSVWNYGDYCTINTGDGNDYYYGYYTHNCTINTGEGNDSVKNYWGDDCTINTCDGSDTVYNSSGDWCTINTGAGKDSVYNHSKYCTINTGAGNDSVYNNEGYYCTINTGAGNDLISLSYGSEDNVIIYKSGDGNDIVYGFDGDDTLSIIGGSYSTTKSGKNIIVTVDDGEISLVGAASLASVNIAGEEKKTWQLNGTTATYGTSSNTIITVSGVKSLDGISLSENTITVGAAALNNSNVTVSNGYILSLATDVPTPQTTAAHWELNGSIATYKNTLTSAGYSVVNNQIVYNTENGGEDLITVDGVKSLDSISLSGNTITVGAAALNNSNVTVSNGYILSLATDVPTPQTTAAHWELNGSIATYKNTLTSAGYSVVNNQIVYNTENGGENLITVSGVKSLDSISLIGNTIMVGAAALNQNNVTVSNGYTLSLATDVPTPQTTAAHWELNGSIATYKNTLTSAGYSVVNNQIIYNEASGGEILITVDGVKSADGISLSGNTITVGAAALNNSNVTVSNGYILSLATDVPTPQTTAAHWELNGTTETYKNTATSAGYSVVNNQIVYNVASGGETLITIDGVKSLDGISLSGNTITVGAAALNNSNVTVSNGYTLSLATDAQTPQKTTEHWELNGSTATYKNTATSAGYSVVNNQIVYNVASGGETLITIDGVKSLDGISLSGNTITVGAAALNNSNVTVSNGYTLSLATDAQTPQKTTEHWELNGSTATYKNTATSAGYSVVNNQIVYNVASGGETLITIDGVKSLDGISLSGNTITVGAAALNNSNVTVSNGYILKLQGVAAPKYTAAHFDGMTYKSASNTAGYALADNKITYTPAVAEKDLFTISGVKSTDGIMIDDKTVTIPLSALNKSNVTISDKNYNLALADDVKPPETTESCWTLNGTTATYKNAATTAGYSLNANNQIIYNAAGGGNDLIKITGVKSLDGISLSGKVVTVAKSSVNAQNITISGDYKLSLDGEVDKPTTTKAWTFNKKDSVASYDQTTTAGYTLAKNAKSISYSKKATKNLIKVNGVKSANGFKIKNKVVTVPNAALNQKTVTVSDGFTLKLGKDVTKSQKTAATWSYKNKVATYKSASTTAGYTLDKNAKSITYTKATATSTLATVNGIKSNVNPTVKNKVITLKKANLSGSKVTVSGSYGFNFAKGNYNDTSIVGSKNKDSITSSGSNLSITGGKGNDLISLSSAAKDNVIVYNSGDGNDTIVGFDGNDILKIAKGTASVAIKDDDVVFTVGKGTITVKNAAKNIVSNGKKINYIDNTGKHATYPSSSVSLKSSTIKLTKDYDEDSFDVTTYGNSIQTINAAEVVHDISITGNKLANKITGSDENDYINGGAGNDSLNGGDGNDTIVGGTGNDSLSGGNGADLFVYKADDGDDVIVDYADEDKIKIASGTIKSVKNSGNDVIFTVGSNKISVKGAADKTVTYIDAKGKTKYYPTTPTNPVILTGTSAILRETYSEDDFTAKNYGDAIETIDASAVTRKLKITGNGKANLILGGYENDTINGGKGSDTLQGGSGADVFLYAKGDGKDIIIDYASEDTIKITSGKISKTTVSGNDVIFTVGSGKITVQNMAGKTIKVTDANGKTTKKSYKASDSMWFLSDDEDFAKSDELSTIVQNKTADCSFINTPTTLAKENNLITYAAKK